MPQTGSFCLAVVPGVDNFPAVSGFETPTVTSEGSADARDFAMYFAGSC